MAQEARTTLVVDVTLNPECESAPPCYLWVVSAPPHPLMIWPLGLAQDLWVNLSRDPEWAQFGLMASI